MPILSFKKTIIAALISSSLSMPALGTGFPVVDIAGLAQAVTQYSQLIQEYDQILKQTGLNTDQLLTAIDQYTQTLIEYQVLLNQVESLKGKMDRKDYASLDRDVNHLYENHLSDTDVPQSLELSRRYDDFGTREDMNALAEDALNYVPGDVAHTYNLANDANNQSAERELYRSLNAQSREDIAHVDKLRVGLGSQSQLATMQLMVEQNQILIDQIATSNEMKLSSMSTGSFEEQAAQAALRSKLNRLELIKKTKDEGIEIDNRPLR
ncbi:hypothetical protein [Aliivibrio fischeri]|uniref:hypothetical protein n=1 Tax=Aliivibrio fischeri TaxID=668 RepID=UPI00084C6F90|nr:hypothetical protein [Aliivibrio fischeri]OED53642.1 hypothetical protein BEI47_17460 [Aliivibrio fischeri]